jgi:serine/threonine protein kinase
MGGPESHKIDASRRSPKVNLPIPGEEIARKIKIAKEDLRFDPQMYGNMIGGGVNGKAWLAKVTPALILKLKEGVNFGGAKVFYNFPEIGTMVIIKEVIQQKKMLDEVFISEAIRENTVHKNLTDAPSCARVPGATKPACISKSVPKFYLSYVLKKGKSGGHTSITVMDPAGTMSLSKFILTLPKQYIAKLYVNVEHVICSLWLSGYVHGDLHRDNMMVTASTGEVKLIDFGFAIRMPSNFPEQIGKDVSDFVSEGSNRSFAEIWTEKPIDGRQTLMDYSNTIIKQRRYPWYNPDYKILQTLWNQIPKTDLTKIPQMRSEKWGIAIRRSPVKTSPTNSLENGEIRPMPVKKKTPWRPRDGRYWADEESPSEYKSAQSAKKSSTPLFTSKTVESQQITSPAINTGKVDAKKRKVYKNSNGRTYVKHLDKKVYVKKLFTPKDESKEIEKSPRINTGKVDAKTRKVYKNSKGKTYVMHFDKKRYVKKLYTPKEEIKEIEKSPNKNTGKVDAKKRKVYKNSNGRTYVRPGDKKVYVKKLFTPKDESKEIKEIKEIKESKKIEKSPKLNTGKVDAKKRKVYENSKGRTHVMQNEKKIYVKKLFTPK